MQKLVTHLPQKCELEYNQALSANGLKYFIIESAKYLQIKNLDTIDTDARVLCQILQLEGCKFNLAIMQNEFEVMKLNDMFDSYKKEEKQIQEKGVILEYMDGSHIVYQNRDYKLDYHSRKLFCLKYNSYMSRCIINFCAKNEEKNKVLEEIADIYQSHEQIQKIANCYRIDFDIDYRPLALGRLRELTEKIRTLLTIGENMAMYKSGQNETASLEKYAVFLKQYGANSSEAQSYFAKFANDLQFAVEAQKIKQDAISKQSDKEQP